MMEPTFFLLLFLLQCIKTGGYAVQTVIEHSLVITNTLTLYYCAEFFFFKWKLLLSHELLVLYGNKCEENYTKLDPSKS